MEQEIWKPVPGYEGRYEVSSLGRVKALARCLVRANGRPHPQPEKVFKQHPNRVGYLRVGLYSIDNSERKNHLVHRLVCKAFHGAPPAGAEFVNHKDLNKANNRPENLEWVSNQENMDHAAMNGVYNPITRMTPTSRQRLSKELGLAIKAEVERAIQEQRLNVSEVARKHKVSKATVNFIASGLTWSDTQKRFRSRKNLNNPFISVTKRQKMTPETVSELRALAGTDTYAALGARFGISWTTARGIILEKYWKKPA